MNGLLPEKSVVGTAKDNTPRLLNEINKLFLFGGVFLASGLSFQNANTCSSPAGDLWHSLIPWLCPFVSMPYLRT